jgi:hypothetical protein
LVGDSTITRVRVPPRRARFAGGALVVALVGFGAAFLAAGADLRAGVAFAFGAAAFDPFAFGVGVLRAFGVGVLRGFAFFGLLLAIGPGFDRTVSSWLTRKIASN